MQRLMHFALMITLLGTLSSCNTKQPETPPTATTPTGTVREKVNNAEEKMKQREVQNPEQQSEDPASSPSPNP
ncbi:MAG: hypothetical protein SFW36_09030 [Leptolyngbyaceae cyanobacterium bins.59]|nr:hypothetical protein [Leptolyngbyaceae cyanobacterium bins.59]